MSSKVIAVLGMHRSGTSCLTGLLEEAGVFLGDVSKHNPYNLKGNQERRSIMDLHDRVLAANNASWDDPPLGPVVWDEQQIDTLRALIAEYQQSDCWGFKDPRSMFMLNQWRQEIPELEFVGTLRHPLSVAQSLTSRNKKMSTAQAVELWSRYNAKMLKYWERSHFPIVNFNLEDSLYLQSAKRAFEKLGLSVDAASLTFFDSDLKNSDLIDDTFQLPGHTTVLYRQLLACTE